MKHAMMGQFIQTGTNRFTEVREAARLGLRRYMSPAERPGAVSKAGRSATRTMPVGKTATAGRAPAPSQTRRAPPRDIVEAMRRGMSNAEINALVERRALHRPRNLLEAGVELWSVADWHAARQRDLVW